MRVLVCGGVDYADEARVHAELDALAAQHGWLTIIEGGARGADRFAQNWARKNFHGLVTVEADWKTHGKAAGPIRNSTMSRRAKPDFGLAFPSEIRGLKGTGTGDMVERLQLAGIKVKIIGGKSKEGLFE